MSLTVAQIKARLEEVQDKLYAARLHSNTEIVGIRSGQEQEVSALLKLQASLQAQLNAAKTYTTENDW